MNVNRMSIEAGSIAWAWSHEEHRNPVVVLHGLGDSAIHTFAPLFQDSVLADIPALFIDLPGFGEASASPDFSAEIESYAEVVRDLLMHLNVQPRAVFGHSMGGSIAILLAARWPELVPHLIVAEALLVPENSVLAMSLQKRSEESFVERGYAMLRRATHRQALRGDAAAQGFAPVLAMADPSMIHRAATSLVRQRIPHIGEILSQLSMPRAFLVGEHTEADSLGIEDHGVDLIEIPDAGHSMMSEQPSLTAQAIRATLDKRK